MTAAIAVAPSSIRNLAQLVEGLGGIPLDRIRFRPSPGTGTIQDILDIKDREGITCELIDGVVVEKAMGLRESLLAAALIGVFRAIVIPRNLGLVTGPDGTIQIFPGLVRVPDVAFISWSRLPGGVVPDEPVPELVPDIAAEIFSASNTEAELRRKRIEYFGAGVRLVWVVYPKRRTVAVYHQVENPTILAESDTLDGEDVLPGFSLPLRELFAELDRRADS